MVKYRITFTNNLHETYSIDFDNKNYTGDVTDLTGEGQVLSLSSIGDDDDRFSPILSKEIKIAIWLYETQPVTITNFLSTEDDEWRVIIYRERSMPAVFHGYIVIEDSSEPLFDKPFGIRLRASDGLPLLKNVELIKSDESDFRGLNPLTDYIGHTLYYVNPDIPFRIYSDVYHKRMDVNISPFEQTEVDAGTFEKDENTNDDGYTVLEKVLKATSCRLFYENGCFHIVHLRQYQNPSGFNWHEYKIVNGDVVHQASGTNEPIIARIGKIEVIQAVNKDAQVYYKVPYKSVKKTFNYVIPQELFCNQQLQRGDKIPGLSTPAVGTPISPGYVPAKDYYTPECYLSSRSIWAVLSTTKDFYIRTEQDAFGYEIDRYLLIPREPQATFIHSNYIPVNTDDEFTFSVDVKVKQGNDYGRRSGEPAIFYIILIGDDGTYWNLTNDIVQSEFVWVKTLVSNPRGVRSPTGIGSTDWTTVTAAANKINVDTGKVNIPVDGNIQIVLAQLDSFTPFYPNNETYYKNLQINYSPYIKNSYRPVLGDFNFYSQDLKINRTIEEEVHISDSPKKLIKGALFVDELLATPEWYRLGENESLRFMQIQALLKYNFHFRQFRKVEGTLKGLSLFNALDQNTPFGFLPIYSLSDVPNAPNFILTSITECNYVSGQWRGVIVEIPSNAPDFDTYDFQYLFK